MSVEESAEAERAEPAEKTEDGGFEMGVSRSDENSNPGKVPRWSESGGSEDDVEEVYMLQMYVFG